MNTVNDSYSSLQNLYKFAHDNPNGNIGLDPNEVQGQDNVQGAPLLGGHKVCLTENPQDAQKIRQQLVNHLNKPDFHIGQEYINKISEKLTNKSVLTQPLKGQEMSEAMVYALSNPATVNALLLKTMHGLTFPQSPLLLLQDTISECARHPDVISFLTQHGDGNDLERLQKVCALAVQRNGDDHPDAAAFLRGFSRPVTAVAYNPEQHATTFTSEARSAQNPNSLLANLCADADIAKILGDNAAKKNYLNGRISYYVPSSLPEPMKGKNLSENQCRNILGFVKNRIGEQLKDYKDLKATDWEIQIDERLKEVFDELKSDFALHVKDDTLTEAGEKFNGTVANVVKETKESPFIKKLNELEQQPVRFVPQKRVSGFQKAKRKLADAGQTVKHGAQFVAGGVKTLAQSVGAKIVRAWTAVTDKSRRDPKESDVNNLLMSQDDLVESSVSPFGKIKSAFKSLGKKGDGNGTAVTDKSPRDPEESDVNNLNNNGNNGFEILENVTNDTKMSENREELQFEMVTIVDEDNIKDETIKIQGNDNTSQTVNVQHGEKIKQQAELHNSVNIAFGDEFRTRAVNALYEALIEELPTKDPADNKVRQLMKLHPGKAPLIEQLDAGLKAGNVSLDELFKAYPTIVRLINKPEGSLTELPKPLDTYLTPLIQHFRSRNANGADNGNNQQIPGLQQPAQLTNVTYPDNFTDANAKGADDQIKKIWEDHQAELIEAADEYKRKLAQNNNTDATEKKKIDAASLNAKFARTNTSELSSTRKTLEILHNFKQGNNLDALGLAKEADQQRQQRTEDFRRFMQDQITSKSKVYSNETKERIVSTFQKLPPALLNLWSNKAIESNQKIVYDIVLRLADVQDAKHPNDSAESTDNALNPADFKTREQAQPKMDPAENPSDYYCGSVTYSIGDNQIKLKVSTVKDNPGHGDCFFYSILDGHNKVAKSNISPVVENTDLLRQKLVNHIETLLVQSKNENEENRPKGFTFKDGQCLVANGDDYTDVTSAFDEYLGTNSGVNPWADPSGSRSCFGDKIGKRYVWADNAQGAFLADMLKRPVVILNRKPKQVPSVVCFDRSLTSAKPLAGDPIVIIFTGGHYEQATLDPTSMAELKKHLAQSKIPTT